MASTEKSLSVENQLIRQLNAFSELTEKLTLRLLELEERILSIEERQVDEEYMENDESKQLLGSSEERMKALNGLLVNKNNLLNLGQRSKEIISANEINDNLEIKSHEDEIMNPISSEEDQLTTDKIVNYDTDITIEDLQEADSQDLLSA